MKIASTVQLVISALVFYTWCGSALAEDRLAEVECVVEVIDSVNAYLAVTSYTGRIVYSGTNDPNTFEITYIDPPVTTTSSRSNVTPQSKLDGMLKYVFRRDKSLIDNFTSNCRNQAR